MCENDKKHKLQHIKSSLDWFNYIIQNVQFITVFYVWVYVIQPADVYI